MNGALINNRQDGSGERLYQIRKNLGMTQIEFAKIINSSNGHISDMEKDRKNITESTIELLKLKCNVNETWLREGTGEMFIQQTQDEQIATFVGNILKDEEDSFKRRLISALCALDDEGWRILEKFIDSLPTKKG